MGRVNVVGLATGYGLDGPGIESRWGGARFSAPVQTGTEAHPSSCTVGTGSFPGVKSGRGVTLTPHPIPVPWSWKSRAVPLFRLWALRPVQSLSACTRVTFTFPLPLILDVAVSQKECGRGKLYVRLWLKHCSSVTAYLQPPRSGEGGFANTDGRFRLANRRGAKRLELCLFPWWGNAMADGTSVHLYLVRWLMVTDVCCDWWCYWRCYA